MVHGLLCCGTKTTRQHRGCFLVQSSPVDILYQRELEATETAFPLGRKGVAGNLCSAWTDQACLPVSSHARSRPSLEWL